MFFLFMTVVLVLLIIGLFYGYKGRYYLYKKQVKLHILSDAILLFADSLLFI